MSESDNGSLFETILEFPCTFPIKIMGLPNVGLLEFVNATLKQHVQNEASIVTEVRQSAHGKYISITATFEAENRQQLDTLYRIFTAHKDVKLVL